MYNSLLNVICIRLFNFHLYRMQHLISPRNTSPELCMIKLFSVTRVFQRTPCPIPEVSAGRSSRYLLKNKEKSGHLGQSGRQIISRVF